MKIRNRGLILIAIIVSVFIVTAPLHSAETTSNAPFHKDKKCMGNSNDNPSGTKIGCRGMGKTYHGNKCGGCWANLTPEDTEKVKKERAAFHKATQDLRQEIKSKNLALKSELTKKEPSADAAMALQADISKLSSQLDIERLKHILSVKKIAPYAKLRCLMGGKGGVCMKDGKNSPFCKQ